MSDLPEPLTPPDCDLRDFTWMPIDIGRLFASEFHALSTDAVWRAGFTLWLKSYQQMPAASLPDDDVALARLADPVAQAMLDAGVYPAPVERRIVGQELTDQQHDDFARIAGGLLHQNMRALIASPNWPAMSRPVRQQVIEEAVRATRNTAADMVKMKYPFIPAAAAVAQRRKLTEGRP